MARSPYLGRSSPSFRSLRRHGLRLLFPAFLACCAAPPRAVLPPNPSVLECASLRNLVDIRAVVPDVICDLRYATKRNVTGEALYPPDMPCLLHLATAEKLGRANAVLRAQGFGLKIWDAWRPPEVQTELFRRVQRTRRAGLFLNPAEAWSFHCAGTAVDVTLVDQNGREVELPTDFDEAGPDAQSLAPLRNERTRQHRGLLQEAMIQSGFSMIEGEWWHFDDATFRETASVPAVFAGEIGLALPQIKSATPQPWSKR